MCGKVWVFTGINKKISVVFYPFPQKPPWMDLHQIWHRHVGCQWQIFWWLVEGCWFHGGQILPFSADKLSRHNTGLSLVPWLDVFIVECISRLPSSSINTQKANHIFSCVAEYLYKMCLVVESVKRAVGWVELWHCSKCRRSQRHRCRRYRHNRTRVIRNWLHWDSSSLTFRLRAMRKLS